MSKFIIDRVVIEKSSKDIKTGIIHSFSDGLNLICGNNEAGKSSLMAFIKQGFFRAKGIDTGKIHFKIENANSINEYRADIKDARSLEQRCKLIDENNLEVNYSFVEKNINQKYFEQGFTINLDDLMNIQNKDTATLVDIIKDPSGEKLSLYVEKLKSDSKKILGDNGRLTKETNNILEKIALINSKISELSNLEIRYNATINDIKTLDNKLEEISQKENLLNVLLKAKELIEQITSLKDEVSQLSLNFNQKMFDDKETYISLIQNSGAFESNQRVIEKDSLKKEQLNSKINVALNRLKSEYALTLSESDLLSFILDFSKIKKVKDILVQKDLLEKELITLDSNKQNIEENLLKLKYEIKNYEDKNISNEEFDSLNDIFKYLDEGLKQYSFIVSKIADTEKNTKINAGGIVANKNLTILLVLLFLLTLASSVIGFYQKVPVAGIFSILMSVLSFVGILSLKLSSYNDKQISDINKDKNLRDSILSDLKEKIKHYYSEIENVESSYLPFKMENLKQEILNKLQNYNSVRELINKNKMDVLYNEEKYSVIKSKLEEIQKQTKNYTNEISSLIDVGNNIKIEEKDFLEVVDIIKVLKEDIEEKNLVNKELSEMKEQNEMILKTLNSFVSNNEINISVSEKYEDNVGKLKAINEKNIGIKNQLDILNAEIQNLENKLNKLKEENNFEVEQCNINLQTELEKLNRAKEEINKTKKEVEYNKRELEEFEGLNDLKIQRTILIDEYREKIEELIKNKMIVAYIEEAKNAFDTIQPDLKNAQKYLEILTDGKYSKINLDLEEIQNESGSRTKKWFELSRGTKEQLYLALRLGYASNYSKDRTTLESNGKADLPIIIDDAFVNFDFDRTRNAVKCLAEFSKTNQVLFFTCHTEMMKKHFDSVCEKYNLINL